MFYAKNMFDYKPLTISVTNSDAELFRKIAMKSNFFSNKA